MMRGRRTASGDGGSSAASPHIPVLLDQVVAALAPKPGERLIDGTFGAGGYSSALLAAADGVRVLGIDRDPAALAIGREIAAAHDGRLVIAEGRFGDLAEIAGTLGFQEADGVVLDIGVSSMQLDEAERGFSFMVDGPLDMRMAQAGTSAADLVNEMDEGPLADLIYVFGEERHSRRIARAIVRARDAERIATTAALARIVEKTIGRKPGEDRHPATRTFQALRIAVNDELGELVRGLQGAEATLRAGGRLTVVTFHSLEDRIVKRFLTLRSGRAAEGSRHAPPVTGGVRAPSFRLEVARPIGADEDEIARNPRARSAKLRWAVRTDAPEWPLDDPSDLGLPTVPDRRRGRG